MSESIVDFHADELVVGKSEIRSPPPRRRKPSLATAKRQADKANLKVTAATFAPDGQLTLQFGDPADEKQQTNKNSLDQWMAKRK